MLLPKIQIFNEFNARKPDEINVFTGVTKNYLFMGIIGITCVLQVSSHLVFHWNQWYLMLRMSLLNVKTDNYHWISWEVHENCETRLEAMACIHWYWPVQVGSVAVVRKWNVSLLHVFSYIPSLLSFNTAFMVKTQWVL